MRAGMFSLVAYLLVAAAAAVPVRKIYAAGSGQDMLSNADTVAEVIALSGKASPMVLYLGTATYDETPPEVSQTKNFISKGCSVKALKVAVSAPSFAEMKLDFERADIVLVSGGNTLFARDRWVKLGLLPLFAAAMSNGTVMCGGSAGGIVWFDGGHSDSMDASSYKNPPGPFLNPNMTAPEMANWAYIRVPGLSIVPGLFCPHYDMTESNEVVRATDFTAMLKRHSGEHGIGVDNWAAIEIDGDNYTLISRKGFPGSVTANGDYTPNRDGRPGAWRLDINQDGTLARTLVPWTGRVADLLLPARYIVQSEQLPVARGQNPDDGIPPAAIMVEL